MSRSEASRGRLIGIFFPQELFRTDKSSSFKVCLRAIMMRLEPKQRQVLFLTALVLIMPISVSTGSGSPFDSSKYQNPYSLFVNRQPSLLGAVGKPLVCNVHLLSRNISALSSYLLLVMQFILHRHSSQE
jgi:hypothetical protein